MSEGVTQFEQPLLTPEAALVLQEIEAATAAVGFPINGYAKLNAVSDTLVGPEHSPVSLGTTVELTVPIAADGAPLPPPGQRPKNETAAAIMIIRVAPERAFGVLCWRAWVNLVEVSTARAFFSQQSTRPEENWDILAGAPLPPGIDPLDLDQRLDQAVSGLTTLLPQSPGEAITQAFSAGVEEGRLSFGREWAPPIQRLHYFAAEQSDEATDDEPLDHTSEPESAPPPSEDRITWYSSFALVAVAASIGLVVGLAVLWAGGRADAGTTSQHRPLVGQLLTGASEDALDYDLVLAFRYDQRYYPITLFRTVEPDLGCSVQHVHLATIETLARSFEAPDDGIYDPDPPGCGFGAVESLAPAPYPILHQQLHDFCSSYRRETPDWFGTATTALCESRAPDAAN